MNTDHKRVNDLLVELRSAGPRPGDELLNAIREQGMEAIPALIAMVTNPAEYMVAAEDEDGRSGWAPYSGVELLGQLHPAEALEPLVSLLSWDDYDYLAGVVPEALAQFGREALDPLTTVLADQSKSAWTRWRAADAMEKMAGVYPELRDEIVARLTRQLDTDEPDFEDLDVLRGALVSALVELVAQESIPSIVRAFEETWIDPYIVSWSDVRNALEIPPDVAAHLDRTAPDRGPLINLPSMTPELEPSTGSTASTRPRATWTSPSTYRRDTPKVGRNDPCPCGSGKKFKKCHGR